VLRRKRRVSRSERAARSCASTAARWAPPRARWRRSGVAQEVAEKERDEMGEESGVEKQSES